MEDNDKNKVNTDPESDTEPFYGFTSDDLNISSLKISEDSIIN